MKLDPMSVTLKKAGDKNDEESSTIGSVLSCVGAEAGAPY